MRSYRAKPPGGHFEPSATQAAIRAGYSEATARSQGQRLLTNADIEAAIVEAQNQRSQRTQITQDRILRPLRAKVFSQSQREDFSKVTKRAEHVSFHLAGSFWKRLYACEGFLEVTMREGRLLNCSGDVFCCFYRS
ncbi:terminase small subunit [Roseibium aggregatum]|uniref:terminase small subunit n=1 Tax=Roseibium aggregatum TaxID=187304 RepID=UPI0009EB5702|nr:terminase small subunit [Roseibium aggregatum]